jgi:aspartyl protease family protein
MLCFLLFRSIIFLLVSFYLIAANGQPGIKIIALFPGKAMIVIDGKNHMLKKGDAGTAGIRLISASPQKATIEVNGVTSDYFLDNTIGSNYAVAKTKKHRIARQPDGQYVTTGTINGQSTQFLVDTGASAVALSGNAAKKLGILYRRDGTQILVQTASGTVRAYQLYLKSIRLGGIGLNNIEALVIEGAHPPIPLLGMSFLNQVQIKNEKNLLILSRDY